MKRLLIVLFMFALVGGGVGALWYFKVPPFARPAKKNATVAAKGAKRAAPVQIASAAPPTSASPAVDAAAHPETSPAPLTKAEMKRTPKPEADEASKKKPAALSESDLNRLAGVYEAMPIEDATKIMSKLPDTVVEPLLRRMDEKQVGKLLGSFTADRAAKLTLAMARTSEPAKLP